MIAIIDYGLGNLFSIQQACSRVGMKAKITSAHADIRMADAVILPGVGAFGDAMQALNKLDLVEPLRDFARSGKALVGICLGLQLLFSESHEFGLHRGLGILEGQVVRFGGGANSDFSLKVPQVCWNRIFPPDGPADTNGSNSDAFHWKRSPLEGIAPGAFMYFVHSYYVVPRDETVWLSRTRYGPIEFCSAIEKDNIVAFQFHPERSGPAGLRIYENLFERIAPKGDTHDG